MRRVDKPWGHELWWALTDRYVGKLLHIEKGESLSLQYHDVKDETIMRAVGPAAVRDARDAGRRASSSAVEMRPGRRLPHHARAPLHRMTGARGLRHRRGLDARARRRGPARRPLRPRGHLASPSTVRSVRPSSRDRRAQRRPRTCGQDRVLEHRGVADEGVERADAAHGRVEVLEELVARCGPRSRRRSPRSGCPRGRR